MAHAHVFGLLAPRCRGGARKMWNALICELGVDAFFDFYPTVTTRDLELRLAEMFHLERRAYILGDSLRTAVRPLLDRVDASAHTGEVDTVINERGVLVGYSLSDRSPEEQLRFWISQSTSPLSD